MNLGSQEFEDLIHQSAALRSNRDFAGAIKLIESKLAVLDPDCLLNAYLECFRAAREAGMADKADEYAAKLRAIDPHIPSVKPIFAESNNVRQIHAPN